MKSKIKNILTPVLTFSGPVVATLVGVYTVTNFEMPASVFYPNFAAILTGLVLAILLMKWHQNNLNQIIILALVSIALLGSTFLFEGQLNVHRWMTLGSLNINISMIILPIILFCIHYFLLEKKLYHAAAIFIITGALLVYQPDAGQATSFALGALILFALNKTNIAFFIGSVIMAGIITVMSWLRVDMLEPVEYVEEILSMLRSLGPIGYFLILLSAFFIFFPFFHKKTKTNRAMPTAFMVYILSTFIVTEFGHFPVPLLGAGASPIIGWYLMVGFIL